VRAAKRHLPNSGEARGDHRAHDENVGEVAKANAAALERALAARRRELSALGADERDRSEESLALIEQYAALLREPGASPRRRPARYCFKLVFPDGRWSVDEKQLLDPPNEGDILGFDGIGEWKVEGSEHVGAKPPGKPSRQIFVCAPA
jgi:hypothetical protein